MNGSILFWNQVALDARKADFAFPDALPTPRPPETVPQQPGPTCASRALAIVHLAMYDAYVGIKTGGAPTHLGHGADAPARSTAVQASQAPVAAAACVTLIAMFSRQKATFLQRHDEFVTALGGGFAGGVDLTAGVGAGLAWGTLVATRMLAARSGDGSEASNDLYAPGTEPYAHRADPYTPDQGFLGPRWGEVRSFGFENLRPSLTALPDPKTLAGYDAHFASVKALGERTSATRTNDQTTIGIYWADDGARNLGVPPRLYNQVVRSIVGAAGKVDEEGLARLFAMVNVAMADAGIQAWQEKYRHNLRRPVVGIREADAGWGPTAVGDGRAATEGDPCWEPPGAPRTNSSGPASFTPNFPAYPSGHATFGTAAFRVVQRELNLPKDFRVNFVSDEFNGVNVGADGVRPKHTRSLTINQATEENILSRVYLGVHWELDGRMGAQIGEEIATKLVAAFPNKA